MEKTGTQAPGLLGLFSHERCNCHHDKIFNYAKVPEMYLVIAAITLKC